MYARSAQGSRNAPLSWAALVSLVARCTQSLFYKPRSMGKKTTENVRMEVYVDDPAIVARGTTASRDRYFTVIVLVWRALGFRLAFSKAKRGFRVPWIGNEVWSECEMVKAGIQEHRVLELKKLVDEYRMSNIISLKSLRSLSGKCSNFSTLLFSWRPFLSELWAAQHSSENSNSGAPPGCVWTNRLPTPWPGYTLSYLVYKAASFVPFQSGTTQGWANNID